MKFFQACTFCVLIKFSKIVSIMLAICLMLLGTYCACLHNRPGPTNSCVEVRIWSQLHELLQLYIPCCSFEVTTEVSIER